MAGDERRAEIEAVCVEALTEIRRRTTPQGDAGNQVAYELSGAALDRVRDARGDDEVARGRRDARGDEEGLPEPQSVKEYKAMVRGAGLRALIPYVHRASGFGIHNCDFDECQIEGCPTLRSLLARSPESDAADAIRALAGCYDEQLLRSDHVLDDLLEDGRGWLRVSRDRSGPAHLALTMEGRRRIVALLIRAQGDA